MLRLRKRWLLFRVKVVSGGGVGVGELYYYSRDSCGHVTIVLEWRIDVSRFRARDYADSGDLLRTVQGVSLTPNSP